MSSMFYFAKSFNGDPSQWDASKVTNMVHMFEKATSFKWNLCGVAWGSSKASKVGMFEGLSGSISPMTCTTSAAFSP